MDYSVDELASHLKVDRNALDDQCEDQPELVWHAGQHLATSRTRKEKAEERLKVVAADLDPVVREELANQGKKVNETTVKAAIRAHQDYDKAQRRYLEAVEDLNRAEALHEAMKARGFALTAMVELYKAQYYQTNSRREDNSDEAYRRTLKQRQQQQKAKRVQLDDQDDE